MEQPPAGDDIDTEAIAARLRAALDSGDLARLGPFLDENVRWDGTEETPETCHSRSDVLNRLAGRVASGVETEVIEVVPGVESVLVGLRVTHPASGGSRRERSVHQLMALRDGLIVDIRGLPSREAAAVQAGIDPAVPVPSAS
jgi:ketosteroid isomerase-like protein